MANAGVNTSLSNYAQGVNTNDTQFFITTTGSPNSELGYNYTIFGQLVSGLEHPHADDPGPGPGESELPGRSLQSRQPAGHDSGVALLHESQRRLAHHTTQAQRASRPPSPVTAHDRPTVPPSADLHRDRRRLRRADRSGHRFPAAGQSGHRDCDRSWRDDDPTGRRKRLSRSRLLCPPGTLTYSLVSQPKYGTISDFNASTGTFVYTPKPGVAGTDTFEYEVQEVGPAPVVANTELGPDATTDSDPATVTVTVPQIVPTITWTAPAVITYGTAFDRHASRRDGQRARDLHLLRRPSARSSRRATTRRCPSRSRPPTLPITQWLPILPPSMCRRRSPRSPGLPQRP